MIKLAIGSKHSFSGASLLAVMFALLVSLLIPDVALGDVGGGFVWAKGLGGEGNDHGNGISVDGSGNVYTTGFFRRTVDFDPGASTSNLTSRGGDDVFISKSQQDADLDVTAPVVTITTPSDGASYDQGQSVPAVYRCTDEAGGSGIAACDGNVAMGAAIDTATTGDQTFTVTGTDNAGTSTTLIYNYKVAAVTQPIMIQVGDQWRYLKGTAEPPINWNTARFDDSSWDVGPTGIGYGDGDDATVLSDMGGNYASVYLRQTFSVVDPSTITSLLLSVDYDDSFVAYLNGTEVARDNVDGGPPAFSTLANDSHEASGGNTTVQPVGKFDITPFVSSLVAGNNVLALQGHNVRLGSSDFSLIPSLIGGDDDDGDGVANGNDNCPDTPAGVAVEANGCPIESLLVQVGDQWRYFKGTAEPPFNWKTTRFSDSTWSVGPSGFGFADGDDATVLSDMQDNYTSVFLRKTFNVVNPSTIKSLLLRVDYDDAFVAYLNGTEVARDNVDGGPPGFNAVANGSHEASGGNTTAQPVGEFNITPFMGSLVTGDNVLALQGHNVSLGSSDFSLIPSLSAVDTAPVITLMGADPVDLAQFSIYLDAGATAVDVPDGDITASIVTVNPVDTNVVGTYTVTYDVADSSGNAALQVTRTVNVVDATPPVITLMGADPVDIAQFSPYVDAGATAVDVPDGDITASIVTVNPVNTNVVGTYIVTYDVVDSSGNAALQVTRTVNVVDATPPVITLTGADPVDVAQFSPYLDAGATALDVPDGDITASIVTVNPVDANVVGTYIVTYDVADSSGNAALQVTRTVNVVVAGAMPVAFWKFDEGAGTTASDSSGNENTGALENGTAWLVPGLLVNSVGFDGINDRVLVPNSADLNFGAADNLSLSFWFKDSTKGPNQTDSPELLEKQGATGGFYQVRSPNINGDLRVQVDDGPNQDSFYTTAGDLADGIWHHVVVIREVGVGIRAYVDNTLAGSDNTPSAGSLTNNAALQIGAGNTSGVTYDGHMEQTRIYRQVLSAAEIAQLFDEGSNGPVANAGPDQFVATDDLVTLDGSGSINAVTYSWTLPTRPTSSTASLTGAETVNPSFTADLEGEYIAELVVSDGTVNSAPDSVSIFATDGGSDVVGYWSFDEGTGSVANDASANGNDGFLINEPVWIDGKIGKALQFDASQSQSVLVEQSGTLDFDDASFSVVLWMKYTNNDDADIIRKGSTGTAPVWFKMEVPITQQKITFNVNTGLPPGSSPTLTSPLSYDDGVWHHVASVREVEGNRIRLYVDGVQVASATNPVGSVSNSADMSFASKDTSDDDFFSGALDEIKIYSRALSAAEVLAMYQAG